MSSSTFISPQAEVRWPLPTSLPHQPKLRGRVLSCRFLKATHLLVVWLIWLHIYYTSILKNNGAPRMVLPPPSPLCLLQQCLGWSARRYLMNEWMKPPLSYFSVYFSWLYCFVLFSVQLLESENYFRDMGTKWVSVELKAIWYIITIFS